MNRHLLISIAAALMCRSVEAVEKDILSIESVIDNKPKYKEQLRDIAVEYALTATVWQDSCYEDFERNEQAFTQENGAYHGPFQLTLPYSTRIRRFLLFGITVKGHGCIPCKIFPVLQVSF